MSQFGRKRGRAVDPALAALGDPDDDDGEAEELEAAEEPDQAREAADEAEIDRLEAENPELVLSPDEVKLGQVAVEKVCFSSCASTVRMFTSAGPNRSRS